MYRSSLRRQPLPAYDAETQRDSFASGRCRDPSRKIEYHQENPGLPVIERAGCQKKDHPKRDRLNEPGHQPCGIGTHRSSLATVVPHVNSNTHRATGATAHGTEVRRPHSSRAMAIRMSKPAESIAAARRSSRRESSLRPDRRRQSVELRSTRTVMSHTPGVLCFRQTLRRTCLDDTTACCIRVRFAARSCARRRHVG